MKRREKKVIERKNEFSNPQITMNSINHTYIYALYPYSQTKKKYNKLPAKTEKKL